MFPGFSISKSRETESRLVIVRDGEGREREWKVITNEYSFFLGWQKWFEISGVNCCCSATQLCLTLCDTTDCGTLDFPVLHHLLEFAQTHIHRVGDAIQPSHPLLSPSSPAFYLSQYQGLFRWVSSSHWVAKVLELQLQHLSFQWIFRTDFL